MRRSYNYSEVISRRLRNPVYARAFLDTLMEEPDGLTPVDALRSMIEVMGITEFAKLAKVPKSRVIEFTKDKRTFKPATLDLLIKPFKLRTRLIFVPV
ncbi:MAG: hypothetical protein V1495_04870 [Pseudomonadota bacterium]